jgi:hypothetical protein
VIFVAVGAGGALLQTPQWAGTTDPLYTNAANFNEWYAGCRRRRRPRELDSEAHAEIPSLRADVDFGRYHDVPRNLRVYTAATFVWGLDPLGTGKYAYVWDEGWNLGPYFPIDARVRIIVFPESLPRLLSDLTRLRNYLTTDRALATTAGSALRRCRIRRSRTASRP